jgi:cold shock CspA family protein
LTNPAKQNIITSIRGSRRPVADIKSEPRPASNRNQWPASYWNAWPASSVSAFVHISAVERAGLHDLNEGQKIAYEVVADRRTGKSSADNLKPV